MEMEHYNICERKYDGIYSNKINNKGNKIQKMVNILESYGEKKVDKIINQIYKNWQLKCKKIYK